jgi:Polysaccharide lyase
LSFTAAGLRRLSRLAALACAVVTAAVLPAAAQAATMFDGSMETPLSTEFQITTQLGAAPPQRVTSPVRAGSHAAEMTVKPGQKRSELQAAPGGTTLKVYPGSTEWFADSEYLVPGFPTTSGVSNGWQTVLQWKDAGGTRSSSPPISVDIRNGEYTLYGGWGCPSGPKPFRLNLAPARTGTWTDFKFQIHFDTAGKGWVDAYANGQQVVSHFMPPCGTAYPAPYSRFQMLRVGYYRDPKIQTAGTIIHDEYWMGATLASVSAVG